MILLALAALLAISATLILWRRARLARNPAAWPPGLTFKRQLALAKSYLRQNGWTLLEPQPARNIFIHARRERVSLVLMVHGEETLTLPTLLKDCIDKAAPFNIVMGILSQQTLSPDFQDDAARNGIYIVNPTDLADITTHIRNATAKQKKMKEASAADVALKSFSERLQVS